MKKLIIDVPDDMYDLIKNDPKAYYPCGEWVINGKILLEENGESILRAMQESADATKEFNSEDYIYNKHPWLKDFWKDVMKNESM